LDDMGGSWHRWSRDAFDGDSITILAGQPGTAGCANDAQIGKLAARVSCSPVYFCDWQFLIYLGNAAPNVQDLPSGDHPPTDPTILDELAPDQPTKKSTRKTAQRVRAGPAQLVMGALPSH